MTPLLRHRTLSLALILAAGAAAVGLHALGGLMLTPFFGPTPLFWSTIVLSFPVSVSLGLLFGQPLARSVERRPRVAAWTGVFAGLLVLAVPIVLAPATRYVLDRDPDSPFAPPIVVLLVLALPSAAAAATLPGSIERSRESAKGARRPRRRTIGSPGIPLLLFSLGGALGIAACSPSLVDPGDGKVWHTLWLLGGVLVAAGILGLRPASGALALALAVAPTTLFLAFPNELREFEFEKAMRQAWTLRLGRYYLDTAGRRVLDGSEVARRYEDMLNKIACAPDKSVAAVLVVETLKGLGPVQMTGAGLRHVLELYLPQAAKPTVMPLLKEIATIRSDGKGTISLSLLPRPEGDPVRIVMSNEKGEATTFVISSDFTLTLHVEESPEEKRTTIDIGPLEIEKAGFLASNDTYKTPIVIEDAALFFDAHLLGFTVIARRDRVVIRVRAQASIGGIKESVLQVVDLADLSGETGAPRATGPGG